MDKIMVHVVYCGDVRGVEKEEKEKFWYRCSPVSTTVCRNRHPCHGLCSSDLPCKEL